MENHGFDIETLETRFEMQAIDPVGVVSSLSPMSSSGGNASCTVTASSAGGGTVSGSCTIKF